MKQYNSLLTKIADADGIIQGLSEDTDSYKVRIIYSAIGEAAFASVFDDNGENDTVSITHVKRRVCGLLQDYKELFPECVSLLTHDGEELAEEIYWLYRSTGIIYHKQNHIAPAAEASAKVGDVLFTRAYSPGIAQIRSGLGTYSLSLGNASIADIHNLYHLESDNLRKIWEKSTSHAAWIQPSSGIQVEYLNVPTQKRKNYWVDQPSKECAISLCRTGLKGSRIYYLFKMENGQLMISPLEQWKAEYPLNEIGNSENHRLYTNACLAYYHKLPSSRYHVDGDIVRIIIGYLMPPAERYFLNLYSWPESQVSLPYNFKRICSKQVFYAIKEVLEPIGFDFVEE